MPLEYLIAEGQDNGRPIGAPAMGVAGQSIEAPGAYEEGRPIGGPASIFNIMGAPIAVLGGVFEGGFPIGGPVSQIFRGGSAPVTPELFIATLSPAGPIGTFFIGAEGAPIGVDTFGGGALPIEPPQAVAVEAQAIGPLTAIVATQEPIGFGNGG